MRLIVHRNYLKLALLGHFTVRGVKLFVEEVRTELVRHKQVGILLDEPLYLLPSQWFSVRSFSGGVNMVVVNRAIHILVECADFAVSSKLHGPYGPTSIAELRLPFLEVDTPADPEILQGHARAGIVHGGRCLDVEIAVEYLLLGLSGVAAQRRSETRPLSKISTRSFVFGSIPPLPLAGFP